MSSGPSIKHSKLISYIYRRENVKIFSELVKFISEVMGGNILKGIFSFKKAKIFFDFFFRSPPHQKRPGRLIHPHLE